MNAGNGSNPVDTVKADLIQQLQHPDPARRRSAIKALVQAHSTEAAAALEQVRQHDPLPELRGMAAKALRYLAALPLLSPTIPGLSPAAEAHYQAAHRLAREGHWHDAMHRLGMSLQQEPRLRDDEGLRHLAAALAGRPADEAVVLLADAQGRRLLAIEHLPARTGPPVFPLLSRRGALVALLLLVLLTQYIIPYTLRMAGGVLAVWNAQQWKQDERTLGNLSFYTVTPPGTPPAEGWPLLLALDEAAQPPERLLSLLAEPAAEAGVLLVVAHFPRYRRPHELHTSSSLQDLVELLYAELPLAAGPVLFGAGEGGEVASRYGQDYPLVPGGLVLSGATHIYPPPQARPDLYHIVIYGEFDPLLEGSSEHYVAFTDMSQWPQPLSYIVMGGVGSVLTPQHATLVIEALRQVHPAP